MPAPYPVKTEAAHFPPSSLRKAVSAQGGDAPSRSGVHPAGHSLSAGHAPSPFPEAALRERARTGRKDAWHRGDHRVCVLQ